MKAVVLEALPPGVVATTFPVLAPAGTTNVTLLSEFTVKAVTATPPTEIADAWINPVPLITTWSPTLPLVGAILVIFGVTLNTRLLISVLLGVVILTNPVSPDGTFTVR